MNPLVGKGIMRADRLSNGLQYERLQARRAHLLYGSRESVLDLPPQGELLCLSASCPAFCMCHIYCMECKL